MRRLATLLIVILAAGTTPAQDKPEEPSPKAWPREFTQDGHKLTLYQPQLNSWDDYTKLSARAAFAVGKVDAKEPHYGWIGLNARTETDMEEREVLVRDVAVGEVNFPDATEEQAAQLKAFVEKTFGGRSWLISLDRILAGLQRTKNMQKKITVNLDPPPIFYSETPAVLVQFMGDPVFKPIKGTNLLFAANTNWDVFLEKGSGRYFLLVENGWMTAPDAVKGPWTRTTDVPADFAKLPKDKNWDAVLKSLPAKPLEEAPAVLVSTRPSELILTDGTPQLASIPSTPLLFVKNTESRVFLDAKDGNYYFLAAGRWFRSEALEGPWTAASQDLPTDFARIPENHETADVLASVPGTADAREAAIQASIPRKATVKRSEVKITVVYEGDPEFVVVDGTKTVYYAKNTSFNVFRVDGLFYCCNQGIWFMCATPSGTWVVCDSVPKVIYTIPATSPMHNVTYVHVYESKPDTVVVGYTSGYSGAYVAATGLVMFGLGMWAGSAWHHHHHHHSHWYGYGCGAHYSHYHGGYYRTSSRYYGPYGGAGRGAVYNPHTGGWARGGYAYGPRGAVAGRAGYNPYTGRSGAQVRASTPYGSWGRSAVTRGNEWARAGHRSGPRGTVVGAETSRGGKAVAGTNRRGNGFAVAKDKNNNVYVGRDGNVYKRDSKSGWQQRSGSKWSSSNKNRSNTKRAGTGRTSRTPSTSRSRASSSRTRGQLNRDSHSRSRGNQSASRSRNSRSRSAGRSSGRSRSSGARRRAR